MILALSDEPQSTQAWKIGAAGEERLGRRLDAAAGPLVRVLHDRAIPGSRANIDHIVLCSSGILVIDAKRYKGRPHLRREGGLFSPRTEKLGKRNCTRLVDGVLTQVGLVHTSLLVPILGVLCFVDADWPMLASPFRTRGVSIIWPKKLIAEVTRRGALTESDLDILQGRIMASFPVV